MTPLILSSAAIPQLNVARTVRPKILDGLSPDSPAARASRRDLRIINRLQGNHGWFENMLRNCRRTGEHTLEIGAGTGELGRALGAIAPDLAGLDLVRRPQEWRKQAPWFKTDVLDFTGWADYPIVLGNLFFHHFDDAELAQLAHG